jgi:arylsulfatase
MIKSSLNLGICAIFVSLSVSAMQIPALRAQEKLSGAAAPQRTAGPAAAAPFNVLFVICDQESYHLRATADYVLPARQALQKRGVTFRNHYIGSGGNA